MPTREQPASAAPGTDETTHLATLRPSILRRVQAGALSWTTIDLLDVDGPHAAALRGCLEVFGVQVNYLPIGQPRHLIAALGSDRPVAPLVIIAAHGAGGKLLLDDLDETVARYQPFRGPITPRHIRDHLRLPGSTVLVTACDAGTAELAAAFLQAGAGEEPGLSRTGIYVGFTLPGAAGSIPARPRSGFDTRARSGA